MAGDTADFRKKIDPGHDQFEIEDWPFYHMARLVGLYNLKMDNALKPIGMDVSRWRVLNILANKQSATITDIASQAVVRMPTMAKIIHRMASDKLVSTQTSAEDSRSTLVRLTDDGRRQLDALKARAGIIGRQAFMNIKDDDIRKLNEISRKIYANLFP